MLILGECLAQVWAKGKCSITLTWPFSSLSLEELSAFFSSLFFFLMIIDSPEVTKIVQRHPLYPSPSFCQWPHLT